jgi:predicted transcriptional regulator
MTADELKKLRIEAGLSISRAARMMHVADRTWCRYESGKQAIPEGVVELFCIKNKMKYTPSNI